MKKLLLYFLLLIAATSCEIQYNGQSRYIVEGTLKDRSGNPIAQKLVEVAVEAGYNSEIICNTSTDSNGHFLMGFPQPSNSANEILITILQDANLQSRTYRLTQNQFVDYKFTVPDVPLYQLNDESIFRILLNSTNPSQNNIEDIEVEGFRFNAGLDYFDTNNPIDYNEYANYQFSLIKNQTITIRYKIYSNSANPVLHTETFFIGNDSLYNYTITY